MSSPCSVVIDLCTFIRCGMTASRLPCHLHDAPGHGQQYGRNSHVSSCSTFSVCVKLPGQPVDENLHGNEIVLAIFSSTRLRTEAATG